MTVPSKKINDKKKIKSYLPKMPAK